MSSLFSAVTDAEVVVCCGPGGVGKTTVSAILALHLAAQGKRVCVLTVDPARRLADALGITVAGSEPVEVPGVVGGSCHALMLDTEGTFDALIDRYAQSDEQATAIKANRLYRSLTSAVSGTQEYMAMEKLYELCESAAFDVVVVDTPPTRNALDLLDAPNRLTSFLENRIFRALLAPTKVGLRALSVATKMVLSTIGKVAGAELVSDAVTFFQAFAGMEEGFVTRAGAIHERLRSPSTSFLLVTSPRADAIAEAQFFADRLSEAEMRTAGVVVNRVHPRFLDHDLDLSLLEVPGDLGVLSANLAAALAVADSEHMAVSGLISALAPAPVATIPLTADDLHDVASLRALGPLLEASEGSIDA